MTEDQLKAIEARAEAATPGPWRLKVEYYQNSLDRVDVLATNADWGLVVRAPTYASGEDRSINNARLIAHSREDIPALIAALREATELVEITKKTLHDIKFLPPDTEAYMLRLLRERLDK